MEDFNYLGLSESAALCNVVWGKVRGWSWWPAQRIPEKIGASRGLSKRKNDRGNDRICVIFFGGSQVSRISNKQVMSWREGIQKSLHLKARKRREFLLSLKETVDFLQKGVRPSEWWCDGPQCGPKPDHTERRRTKSVPRQGDLSLTTVFNPELCSPSTATENGVVRVTQKSEARNSKEAPRTLAAREAPGCSAERSADGHEGDMMEVLYGAIDEVETSLTPGITGELQKQERPETGPLPPSARLDPRRNSCDGARTPSEEIWQDKANTRREQEKDIQHNGNLTMDDIIDIARTMRSRSCANSLAGTCKEILGTCVSVGCTVEHEDPREIQAKIDAGEIEVPEE